MIYVNDVTIHKVAKNALGQPIHFMVKLVNGCVIRSLKCNAEGIYGWKQKAEEKQKELSFVTHLFCDGSHSQVS